jgi:hypothetical protein
MRPKWNVPVSSPDADWNCTMTLPNDTKAGLSAAETFGFFGAGNKVAIETIHLKNGFESIE